MKKVGSRLQVMRGTAKQTGGGLRKRDLKYNKHGKIVSKKVSTIAKKNLKKGGYKIKNMIGGQRYKVEYNVNGKRSIFGNSWEEGFLNINNDGTINLGNMTIPINTEFRIENLNSTKSNQEIILDIISSDGTYKIKFEDGDRKTDFVREITPIINSVITAQVKENSNLAKKIEAEEARPSAATASNSNNINRAIADSIVTSNREAHRRAAAAARRAAAAADDMAENKTKSVAARARAVAARPRAASAAATASNSASGSSSAAAATASNLTYQRRIELAMCKSRMNNNRPDFGVISSHGYYSERIIKGDGSCFFRSITLRLIELCWKNIDFCVKLIIKIQSIQSIQQTFSNSIDITPIIEFFNEIVLNLVDGTHDVNTFIEYSNRICEYLNANTQITNNIIIFLKLLVINRYKNVDHNAILSGTLNRTMFNSNNKIAEYLKPVTYNYDNDPIILQLELEVNINIQETPSSAPRPQTYLVRNLNDNVGSYVHLDNNFHYSIDLLYMASGSCPHYNLLYLGDLHREGPYQEPLNIPRNNSGIASSHVARRNAARRNAASTV